MQKKIDKDLELLRTQHCEEFQDLNRRFNTFDRDRSIQKSYT